MKKNRSLFLLAAGVSLGFAACNSSGDKTTGTSDSADNMANTATSAGNYAARADSVKTNVEAGYYLNPKTGKKYTNLTVDPNTGTVTDETGTPVKRYVDTRNWWVYDARSWDTVGSAQMRNGSLVYRDAEGNWVSYNRRWSDDDTSSSMNDTKNNSAVDTTTMSSDSKLKIKTGEGKLKADKKGVKTKPKNQ